MVRCSNSNCLYNNNKECTNKETLKYYDKHDYAFYSSCKKEEKIEQKN